MSVSADFLDELDKLVIIANEKCTEDLQCRHCYATQYLSDIRRFVDDGLTTIELDCKKE